MLKKKWEELNNNICAIKDMGKKGDNLGKESALFFMMLNIAFIEFMHELLYSHLSKQTFESFEPAKLHTLSNFLTLFFTCFSA